MLLFPFCKRKTGAVSIVEKEEGVYPIGPQVHSRDIFKYHWNSQETETASNNVLNFKYPDGLYEITATALDLTSKQGSNNAEFLVDNLRPFVKKVEIRKGSATGTLAYKGEWAWNGTSLEFSSQKFVTLYNNDDLFITAYASEAMQCMTLWFGTIQFTSGSQGNDATIWNFVVNQEPHELLCSLRLTIPLPSTTTCGSGYEI